MEGGFEALRRADGLGAGAVGLEGGGTRGNEKVQQQQQTKHCRRLREAVSRQQSGDDGHPLGASEERYVSPLCTHKLQKQSGIL